MQTWEDPFAQMDEDLCQKCHKRKIDRSENPDSVLCRECREEMIKLKIPGAFFAVGAVVILLLLAVAFYSVMNIYLSRFGQVTNAGNRAEDGYIISAMDDLVEVLEENPKKGTAIELADLAMKYSYYDYAAYAIDNYLVGEEVSDSEYDRITDYIDELDKYYLTYDLCDEIYAEVLEEVEDTDDPYEFIEKFGEKLAAYRGDNTYDQAMIYYQLSLTASDSTTSYQYLKKCTDINPYYFDAQAQMAIYHRRQGDLAKSREILEEMYDINKEDTSILRAYATLELVEGNLSAGLGMAELAYQYYPEGTYIADTYIIALAANGQKERAEELIKELEDQDYYFDEDLYDFVDGKMTLEEYYIGE